MGGRVHRKFWEGSLDRLVKYLEETNKPGDQERKGLENVPCMC